MARLSFAHSLQAVRPFLRRMSTRDSTRSTSTNTTATTRKDSDTSTLTSSDSSPALSKLRQIQSNDCPSPPSSNEDLSKARLSLPPLPPSSDQTERPQLQLDTLDPKVNAAPGTEHDLHNKDAPQPPTLIAVPNPVLVVQQASPPIEGQPIHVPAPEPDNSLRAQDTLSPPPNPSLPTQPSAQPTDGIVDAHNERRLANLIPGSSAVAEQPLHSLSHRPNTAQSAASDDHTTLRPYSDASDMATVRMRKIWVKRPQASATLVQIKEDDLVDDVRDLILKKYANSLGRTFDSPDMTLHILKRPDASNVRIELVLGPEEEMCRVIDRFFPEGQKVEDALIIDVPQKRTPRPSPRAHHHQSYHAMDDYRPQETGSEYFPPLSMIAPNMSLNPLPGSHANGDHPRSMAVVHTGVLPNLPSPGATARRHRPKYVRQHTSSPVIISHGPDGGSANTNSATANGQRQSIRPRVDSSASEANRPNNANTAPSPPPLPQSPGPVVGAPSSTASQPPTPGSSRTPRPRKTRKSTQEKTKGRALPGTEGYAADQMFPNISSMLDNSVPPINVLLVEDNSVSLKVMEGLMKRLKVRWQTAMNGKIAVDKWKQGGFHLVLMDIQMPIMNGLQATKEIRRLERVNGIGVFSSSSPSSPTENGVDMKGASHDDDDDDGKKPKHNPEDDELPIGEGLFRSPVIIVALTASSLQSDRHEALAAGCNDFLTKPVSFPWLERKVKEWGCMQALIDFDGWRKWRDYAAKEEAGKSEAQKAKERELEKKQREKMEKREKFLQLQEEKRQRAAAAATAAETGNEQAPAVATASAS